MPNIIHETILQNCEKHGIFEGPVDEAELLVMLHSLATGASRDLWRKAWVALRRYRAIGQQSNPQPRTPRRDWPFSCERSVFSQLGQDGVIKELVEACPGIHRQLVEIGAGNGSSNNTRALIEAGWSGLWVDPLLSGNINHENLVWAKKCATLINIKDVLEQGQIFKGFGLLSVDIDGLDYWLVSKIMELQYRPRIIVVEYNSTWGATEALAVTYDPDFRWASDDYFGASLIAWANLLSWCGYRLIGCESRGVDAFFVHDPKTTFVEPAENLYRPPAYGPEGRGHPRSERRPIQVSRGKPVEELQ